MASVAVVCLIRINRYIMECKSQRRVNACGAFIELIDTLWNVNVITSTEKNSIVIRINRYIMECKCYQTRY